MSRLCRLALLLIVLTSAPLSAQDSADGPNGTIATQSDAATDAAMAVRIRDILGELGGYEDVTVTVSEGIVTLRGTTNSATEAAALGALVTRIEGVVAIKNDVTETTDISRRLNPALERFQARVDQLVTALPLLLISGGIFAGIAGLGWFISSRRWPWDQLAPNAFIADLYRQLVMIVFLVAALVVALDVLNASALLGTILGAAGIVGLAFGFAVRDTVENYIASIMLSIRQPFRPNDTIEINGDEGKVIRLTSRATILLSFDGNHIRIPNATVFKSRIVNYSLNTERRFSFTLAVDWNADIAAVRHLAEETVQALPFVLSEPKASVWIEKITDSGIELVITGWINQNRTSIVLAKGEALRQVKLAIEAAGIVMPEPTYRVLLDNPAAPPRPTPQAPRTPAQVATTSEVEAVTAEPEQALDKLIEAEREQGLTEDLLRDDARGE